MKRLSSLAFACLGALLLLTGCENLISFDIFREREYPDEIELNFNDLEFGRQTWEVPGEIRPRLSGIHKNRNASIVEDPRNPTNRVLKVSYAAGSYGYRHPDNGFDFYVDIAPFDEYFVSFRVLFSEGFDWSLGGKLPGLYGGRHVDGGKEATGDGWSTRLMWKPQGEIAGYVYHMDQPRKYGHTFFSGLRILPNRWYHVATRVRLNENNAADGLVEVWINGDKIVSRKDVRYRADDLAAIDRFRFETFHGGATPEWAPAVDCYALFDDLRVGRDRDYVFETLTRGMMSPRGL